MWDRLRSLSRSRRADSPSRSENERPDSIRKPSGGSISSSLSVADTLTPGSFLDETTLSNSLGLSVLHAPDKTPAIDLIFVHGLGGASIKTWCKGHDPSLCWPKYWLPEDLGYDDVRVLTFGYNAEVLSKTKTKANISDFAKSLLAAMRFEKNGAMEDLGIGNVPIIFVAHSMGGLVLKKAYLRGRNDKEYNGIISQIRAVLFLSTPHRGSNLADTLDRILSVSLTSYTRKAYITELARNSSTIEDLNEDFRHQASNLEIYSFYELRSTVLKGSRSAMIVSKDSSHLGYSEEKSIPLEADHHDVCKYSSREDANYRSVVSVLKTITSKYVDEVEQQNAAIRTQSFRKLESLLSIHSQPQDDCNALKERWTPGTCTALIHNATFTSWMQASTSAGILWMHAGPGTGKSVKSSFLISHLIGSGMACQYFFFKHEDALKRSASVLFRSLAYQISQDMPSFGMALAQLADEGAYSDKSESRQLWHTLFESSLFTLHFERPLYWVIDAVDESESMNIIISSLKKIPETLPIRIIFISRRNPAISTAFSRASGSIPVNEMSIADNSNDIRRFIEREVVYLPGDSKFHSDIIEQLIQRSEGNFLWVHLALQELSEIHSQEDLGQILNEMPAGMESMYRRMEGTISQLSKPSEKLLSKMLLTWTTYGRRPLHIDELVRILRPHFPSLIDLRTSIDQVCGHFVTVDRHNKVSLIHATARDYLRHASRLPFTSNSRSAHGELFDTAMQALLDPQMRSRLNQKKIPPFCEYASTSWAYHLGRCSADSPSVLSALTKFFNGPYVLPWIEILVISRQISDLVYASTSLSTFVQRRRKSDAEKSPLLHRLSDLKLLEVWALDLLKLVGKFGENLLQDSSAIYKFIPQLCPMNSALHEQFGTSSLSQISISGLTIADWDDLSSRLSVGTSHQTAFICCSNQHLAVSTSAKTVVIWNTVSFQEILVLDQSEHILQICVNNSGDRLVSYGFRTTKIWNLPMGHELLCVQNPNNAKPINLTFTDGNKALLICTDTRELRKLSLDDPTQGWRKVYPSVFKDDTAIKDSFTNTPTSVSFNVDISQVAVAYRGAPLEVRDLSSGEIVNRCKRISRLSSKQRQAWTGVTRILWHPIDYEVLGLYTDGVVFKWQPLTESHTELPEAQDGSPSDIQISPNGSTFLTSDVNGSVKIHSFHDFVTIYKLSSEDVVTGMCYSPDSQRFYDIRGSYCNVWEPNALIRIVEFNDQGNDCESEVRSMSSISMVASEARTDSSVSITSLAANPNGALVAFGDDEGNVTLYDIKSDSKLLLAQSSIEMGIERIIWSDDGRYLAYEDLGRRLVVFFVESETASTLSFSWKAKRVLDTKLNLEGGVTKTLLTRPDSPELLAIGSSNAQAWFLQPPHVNASFEVSASNAMWLNHPQNTAQLLAISRSAVTAFHWKATGLEKICEWRLDNLPPGSESADLTPRVILTPNAEYILLQDTATGNRQQNTTNPNLRILPTSSLHPSQQTLPTIHLPPHIATQVETPLTILSSNLFVFISTSLWICTWRFDIRALEAEQNQTHAKREEEEREEEEPQSATTVKAPKLFRGQSEALAKMGVTRHFFLPRDWVDRDGLKLCRVLGDGTFLCPRKGEVAVIRSGVGEEW